MIHYIPITHKTVLRSHVTQEETEATEVLTMKANKTELNQKVATKK